jgi:hypothetical protein
MIMLQEKPIIISVFFSFVVHVVIGGYTLFYFHVAVRWITWELSDGAHKSRGRQEHASLISLREKQIKKKVM